MKTFHGAHGARKKKSYETLRKNISFPYELARTQLQRRFPRNAFALRFIGVIRLGYRGIFT
jgi:hypothetical protein